MPSPADKTTAGPSGGPAIMKSAPFCQVHLASVLHKVTRPRKLFVLSSDVCIPSNGALEPALRPPSMFCAERASGTTTPPNKLLNVLPWHWAQPQKNAGHFPLQCVNLRCNRSLWRPARASKVVNFVRIDVPKISATALSAQGVTSSQVGSWS